MFNPSEFFRFLRRPQYLPLERKPTNIPGTAVKIYLTVLLFAGLIGSLRLVLTLFMTLPIDETLEIPTTLKDNLLIYFSLAAIFGPIAEEIIFRLALVFTPVNLALSLSTLIALLIHRFFGHLFTIIMFVVLVISVYWLFTVCKSNLTSVWKKNFGYVFYSLTVLFALLHISNYRFTDNFQYFIAPLLVLPQLILGFILSFSRLYYQKGFLIAILVHVMINSISVSIYLLSLSV